LLDFKDCSSLLDAGKAKALLHIYEHNLKVKSLLVDRNF